MQDYKEKMSEEIRLRMESDSWNLSIAGRVISEKNARKEKTIFRSYITSLAAASVFILLFIFNVYSYFSSSDVSGYSSYLYSYSSDSDLISTEETDLIINEAFPMR